MLEANKISYRYQSDVALLNRIDLHIEPGEVVGLYGRSGSGKTTLAKIIAGYLKPDEGFIKVDGRRYPVEGPNPVQLIWQHPEKAVNPRWRMKRVLAEGEPLDSDLLDELDIKEGWMHRFPAELSGGELQRFCLARALGSNTKYLIADEMTTMLDAISQAQIWHTVLHLAKRRNLGILAISHERNLLRRVSHRVKNFSELANIA